MEAEIKNTKIVIEQFKSIYQSPDIDIFLEAVAMVTYAENFKKIFIQPIISDDEVKALLEGNTNQSEKIAFQEDDIWVFGYGSLIWKADFPFIDRRPGFITGYQRRFFQNSIDHRGTSSRPGRVVTLIPTHKPEDRVYGMAYRIASKQKDEVQRHLDHREKNGYERCILRFYEFPESTNISFDVNMYIATAENESYAGHIPQLSEIADQIFTSTGPSGSNRDYLFHLAKSMRILFPGVEDKHLYEVEAAVRKRVIVVEPCLFENVCTKEIGQIYKEGLRMHIEEQRNIDVCAEESAKRVLLLKEFWERSNFTEEILAKHYLDPGNTYRENISTECISY